MVKTSKSSPFPISAALPLYRVHSLLASCVPNPPATVDMAKRGPSQALELWSWKLDTLVNFCRDLYPGRFTYMNRIQRGSQTREKRMGNLGLIPERNSSRRQPP